MQEIAHSTMKDNRICPILFYIPGGWITVMPRCTPLTNEEFSTLNIDRFWEQKFEKICGHTVFFGECKIPCEHKIDSFGWLNGQIVAIDYGD